MTTANAKTGITGMELICGMDVASEFRTESVRDSNHSDYLRREMTYGGTALLYKLVDRDDALGVLAAYVLREGCDPTDVVRYGSRRNSRNSALIYTKAAEYEIHNRDIWKRAYI